jgi:hypothetical protein
MLGVFDIPESCQKSLTGTTPRAETAGTTCGLENAL